jgi:hypothetical protein
MAHIDKLVEPEVTLGGTLSHQDNWNALGEFQHASEPMEGPKPDILQPINESLREIHKILK